MTPERWQAVRELLDQALALDPGERAALLEQADPDLRHEAESLLAFEADAANAFPEGELPSPDLGLEPEPAQRQLGPYLLTRELGRGGMGVVYDAERTDGQFHKRVAIKLLPLAFAVGELKQRFLREREILARLEHPAITRLLDGGISNDGAPYLVMEFVDGVPLTEYARAHNLSIRERLRLFLQVCEAVSYAHHRLIVHRDLKPGNILVSGDGQVKLLDFGLAKIIDAGGIDITQTALHMMTPAYASPEQIRGEPFSVSGDIFSMGVLLYELIAGRRPFGQDTTSQTQLLRFVCEEEPAALHADADLKTIVLKSLEKDPQRRYESAEAFASDLTRFLEGRPISARPASAAYRASKFVRRHRWAVLGTAAALISVVAFAAAALVEARRAERRFASLQKLSNTLIFELHDAIEDLPGSTKPRELIVRRGLEYLDQLAPDASSDSALLHQIASGYIRLGLVQAGGDANLGNAAGARESYSKAIVILERLHARNPSDVRATMDLAQALRTSADFSPDGLSLTRRAVELTDAAAIAEPANAFVQQSAANSHFYLAMTYTGHQQFDEAAAEYRKSLAVYQKLNAQQSSDTLIRNIALSYKRLGALDFRKSNWDAAIPSYEAARALDEQLVKSKPGDVNRKIDLSFDWSDLGSIQAQQGHWKTAVEYHQRALALRREAYDADHANARAKGAVGTSLYRLGLALVHAGRHLEAVPALEEAVAIGVPDDRADNEYLLSRALYGAKRQAEAEQHWDASRKLLLAKDPASLKAEGKEQRLRMLQEPPWLAKD